jgi:hypothetical protein
MGATNGMTPTIASAQLAELEADGSLTDQIGAIFPLAPPVAPYGW